MCVKRLMVPESLLVALIYPRGSVLMQLENAGSQSFGSGLRDKGRGVAQL